MSDLYDVSKVKDARIAQMMRVLQVLHDKGMSFTDSLDVLEAIYDVEGRCLIPFAAKSCPR